MLSTLPVTAHVPMRWILTAPHQVVTITRPTFQMWKLRPEETEGLAQGFVLVRGRDGFEPGSLVSRPQYHSVPVCVDLECLGLAPHCSPPRQSWHKHEAPACTQP